MFDLEESVRSWRRVAGPTLGNDSQVLDELESHLRDEFDRLLSSGHAPEEAWAAAMKNLGRPRQIRNEFLKLNRPSWMPAKLAAALLVSAVASLACLMAARLVSGAIAPLLAAHVVAVTAGYTAVLAVGFVGACAVLRRASGPWEERHEVAFRFAGKWLGLIALIATSVGVLLGAWWSNQHLGRWWGWDPREIGGECVLVWSALLVQCFRSIESALQSRMCLAVSGNMIVALAWFGPVLQTGTHGYGLSPSSIGMGLGCFLVSQMLLISLALAAPGLLRRGRSGAAGG